jgi:triosephosphate isomerase
LIIGGNWKMFKTPTEAVSAAKALKVKLINIENTDMVVCPPFTDLVPVYGILKETRIRTGGQNLYWEDEGAFTGEVSAKMLRDSGCEYALAGHSERRHVFGETNQEVNRKVRKALSAGLRPILCVGETIEERKAGQTEKVVDEQLQAGLLEVNLNAGEDLVVAYEPVWAIGTGENATPDQAEEVHAFIRDGLGARYGSDLSNQIRIQYGGSVKPGNVHDLLSQENIDGALVGGASLDPDSFAEIIKSAEEFSM